jgi:hypothetical protein
MGMSHKIVKRSNPFAKADQFRYGREKESTLSEKD